MSEPMTTRFEADLAAALGAYAEAAPIAVDPLAMARAAAATAPRPPMAPARTTWRAVRPALLLAALLALLVAMLLATGTVLLPWLAPPRWVAFQRPAFERNNNHAVHVIRPDGTGQLFAGMGVPGGEQLHPDWSPDGGRIVLDAQDLRHGDSTYDIWIIDTSDWSAKEVVACDAPCMWAQEPAWSRDGTRIAFQRHTMTDAGEVSTIEILDLESGVPTTVYQTDTTKLAYAPRWSPDGGSLVFEQAIMDGGDLTGVSLEIVDLATPGTTRQLIPPEMFANNSDWSSDGSLILFAAPVAGADPGGDRNDIWVVAPDGSGLGRVTDVASHRGSAVKATFTPDSTRIVFMLTDPTLQVSNVMASIALDGTDLQPLVRKVDEPEGRDWMFGFHARLQPPP